jgi:hypothetical protein
MTVIWCIGNTKKNAYWSHDQISKPHWPRSHAIHLKGEIPKPIFENNARVSTFIFQDALTYGFKLINSGGINPIDSKFLVNTCNNDINNSI